MKNIFIKKIKFNKKMKKEKINNFKKLKIKKERIKKQKNINLKNNKNKLLNIFKKEKNKIKFYEGCYLLKDFISPSYINLKNPKYLEIDGEYFSGIIISNYYRKYSDLILKKLIEINSNINISIFYEKQDTYKTLRDLTYHIGNVGVDIKSINENREDIDIAAYTYDDAKYIRKEIQINNEELYFLYIYILIHSREIKQLNYLLNKIEGICQSEGLQTKKGNFRQAQIFNSCMPYMLNNEDIKITAKRNILTSSLVSTYPFISSAIFDENGIFIGTNIYDNSLVFIDRFEKEKYKNANICIFGTSGARKIILY